MNTRRWGLVAVLAVALGLVGALGVSPVFGGGGPPDEPPGSSGDHAIVPLGKALDNGREVEGFAIIHFKKGFSHKPGHDRGNGGRGGGGGGDDPPVTCFTFLANGTRWKTTESYVVDPTNSRELNVNTVRTLTGISLETWDSEVVFDIFGADTGGTVTRAPDSIYGGADTSSTDGQNEVMFGDLEANVIAVTVVWGIFRGPSFMRELVEWDAVFNDDDFDWSTTGDAGKMDYNNIAAHEFGHSAGMGHPDDSCTEETMYSFGANGETKKRDLNGGDIAGINELY